MNIFGKNRGLELTKHLVTAKGYHSLLVIDKCVLITPNIKVHILYVMGLLYLYLY
jgi:hypothetical protein